MATKICSHCGAAVDESAQFCTVCGFSFAAPPESTPTPECGEPSAATFAEETPTETSTPENAAASETSPSAPVGTIVADHRAPSQPQAPVPSFTAEAEPPKDSKYASITTAGFVGIFALMAVPVVNLVLLIIWACGGCQKITKTRFARAMLIIMLISFIICFIIAVCFYLWLIYFDGRELLFRIFRYPLFTFHV